MAGADTQAIDGMLKDVYEDYVQEAVNFKNPCKDLFADVIEDKEFGGRKVEYDAETGVNVSPMFSNERAAFAEAGNMIHTPVSINIRKMIGRVLLTPEAIADSAKSEFAWQTARESEFNGLIKTMARRDEFGMLYQGSGVLARINEADPTTNTTLITDSPGGVSGTVFGNRFIQQGIFVGFVNPNTGALRSGIRKVMSVDSAGANITLDAAPASGTADNDFIVKAANADVTDVLDTEYESAFWGLLAMIDDGTYRNNYFGIDRDLFEAYNAYVSASTGAFSLDVMQQASDVVDQKMGGKVSLLIMHHSIRRLYIQALQADRRYSGEKLNLPDGMTVAFKQGDLTMGEVPVKVIRDFPFGMIMGLDTEQSGFSQYVSEKGKWEDKGGILVRSGTGSGARHSYEAWYYMRKQYHCRMPGYNFRLDGITGASVVVVRPAGF